MDRCLMFDFLEASFGIEALMQDLNKLIIQFNQIELIARANLFDDLSGDGTGTRTNFQNFLGPLMLLHRPCHIRSQKTATGSDCTCGFEGSPKLTKEFQIM